MDNAGKNVLLDLSTCTTSHFTERGGLSTDGNFDGYSTGASYYYGKQKIQELILPDAATSTLSTTDAGNSAFGGIGFQTISGANVVTIGQLSFYSHYELTSVDFPAVQTIEESAFLYCDSLEVINLPSAQSIGIVAFGYCTNLTTVNLPAATYIGNRAFYQCNSLTTVNIPAAAFIGPSAFSTTGATALTVTLGATRPTLAPGIFYEITTPKAVTVRVPSSSLNTYKSDYSDGIASAQNWGNAFRGKGWNGVAYIEPYSSVNTNISLIFEPY
ncbi:MAG: leucine-rich repeat domain-containing protein [Spirochaetaceae bacterium]|nr:leucine-rich repeat domain-containing protein [Spirochaetaceae bacterium]